MKAACVQFSAGPDTGGNLKAVSALVREAAGLGAGFVATPENTCCIRASAADKAASAPAEEGHPVLAAFSDLARDLGIWLLAGSVAVKVPEGKTAEGKMANRSVLFDSRGDIAARYDKIHLFDADLPTGETHRESALTRPGTKAVTARTPFGTVGMTVCYDLRFPALYRALAQAGAAILTVPAAFTAPTGRAHWDVLLRARAIETGSYVLAPAQCGLHEGGRRTWGHSTIVGPWGGVLAQAGDEPGVICADLDLSEVEKARAALPSLRHDRAFENPAPQAP